jgi:hypothetical protein
MLNTMAVTKVFEMIAAIFLFAQSITLPLRIGPVAERLTQQDVAAIQTALPDGTKSWLLIGDPVQVPGLEWIEAYLPATTNTPELRLGKKIGISRWDTPRLKTGWTMERTETYAQVAIPDRNFDEITGSSDINRPFRVLGQFDNNELVSLVQFVRSDPPTKGGASTAIRPWPIREVQRKVEDTIEISTLGGAMSGQVISIRRDGKGWTILAVGRWAA